MKKAFVLLLVFLASFLLFGCTSQNSGDSNTPIQISENLINSPEVQEWSARVAALGNPTYTKVTIASGYEILPFPGLTYSGLREGYQAFYATNKDYTFAIYASPAVVDSGKSFEEVKAYIQGLYSQGTASINCSNISSTGWITPAQAFVCRYNYTSTGVAYKTVVFYKEGKYIQTHLSVWGTELQSYEYIFDEFVAKAVSWK